MRQQTISGIKVSYPDAVVAAFARNPIMIEGFTGSSVEIKVANNDTGKVVTDRRSPFGSEVFFDLAYYLQVMFNQDGLNEVDYSGVSESMTNSFGVVITLSASNIISFNVVAVWASELQKENESLRMFEGYPFTVGVFSDEPHSVKVGSNNYSFDAGQHTIPMSGSGVVSVSTSSGKNRTINVTQHCGEGIYLRWVDKLGIFRYWLFAKGNVTNNITASETFRRKNTGLDIGVKKASKEVGTSVEICAPLASEAEYGYLLGISASPFVEMYNNGEWVEVTIEPGEIIRERTSLQDFIVTLVLPETIVQKL